MKLPLLILTIAVGYTLNGQDSVTTIKGDITSTTFIAIPDSIPVKVTFAKHINDSTYYQVKIPGYCKPVNVICFCKQKYFKGDTIMTARKDIIFEEKKRRLFQ